GFFTLAKVGRFRHHLLLWRWEKIDYILRRRGGRRCWHSASSALHAPRSNLHPLSKTNLRRGRNVFIANQILVSKKSRKASKPSGSLVAPVSMPQNFRPIAPNARKLRNRESPLAIKR